MLIERKTAQNIPLLVQEGTFSRWVGRAGISTCLRECILQYTPLHDVYSIRKLIALLVRTEEAPTSRSTNTTSLLCTQTLYYRLMTSSPSGDSMNVYVFLAPIVIFELYLPQLSYSTLRIQSATFHVTLPMMRSF